jgi:hypothetical protein
MHPPQTRLTNYSHLEMKMVQLLIYQYTTTTSAYQFELQPIP